MIDEKKKHGSKININAIKVGEGNSSDELKKAKIASHGIIAKDKKGKIGPKGGLKNLLKKRERERP